jgi:Fic-DOC domain mobile mystery protein B
MGLELDYIDDQTPLDEDEKEGLLVGTITTRGELDLFEQLNIEKAVAWSIHRNFTVSSLLTESFIKALHMRMFGNVWDWAGTFRRSNKNIGVDWINIGVELKLLLDDTSYWVENKAFDPDELAIRFKHRLVKIHCFPNGNGRHSRMMADIIISSVFGKEVFSWKLSNMVKPDRIRREYIDAIKEADSGNITPLIQFARG